MAERPVVGVRYCGGCNPRYDRVAALRALSGQCPGVEFAPAAPGQQLTLLLCGCSAQCARRDDLTGEVLTLWSPEQFSRAAHRLQSLERSPHPWTGKPSINSAP